MHTTEISKTDGIDCNSCAVDSCSIKLENPSSASCIDQFRPFSGIKFSILSAGYFLLPILFALSGALFGGNDFLKQFAYGTGGLFIGMLLTTLIARLVKQDNPNVQ